MSRRRRLVEVDQGGSTAARPLWVCRHEAAHAVVAHVVGEHVFGVQVSRRGGQTLCARAMGFRGPSMPTLFALAAGQCQAHELEIRAVAAALKRGDLDRRAFLKALRGTATASSKGPSALELAAARANRRAR